MIPLLSQCHLHWLDHQTVYRNLETKPIFKLLVEKTIFGRFSIQQISTLSFYIFNYIEYPLIQAVWLSRGSESRAIALANWWILLTLGWILAVKSAVAS